MVARPHFIHLEVPWPPRVVPLIASPWAFVQPRDTMADGSAIRTTSETCLFIEIHASAAYCFTMTEMVVLDTAFFLVGSTFFGASLNIQKYTVMIIIFTWTTTSSSQQILWAKPPSTRLLSMKERTGHYRRTRDTHQTDLADLRGSLCHHHRDLDLILNMQHNLVQRLASSINLNLRPSCRCPTLLVAT